MIGWIYRVSNWLYPYKNIKNKKNYLGGFTTGICIMFIGALIVLTIQPLTQFIYGENSIWATLACGAIATLTTLLGLED